MVQEIAFLDGQQFHMKTYVEKLSFSVENVDEKKSVLGVFKELCSLAVHIC